MRSLRLVLSSVREGNPAAVVVRGPAGVGKSRLIEESLRRFALADDVVMVGHCVDLYGGEIPFGAVADALRDLIRRRGAAAARELWGPSAPQLGALVPDLNAHGPATSSDQLLDAFVSGLARICNKRTVWLWLEDLHWADQATRSLLSYLLRVTGPDRLLLTCTVRTGARGTRSQDPADGEFVSFLGELLRLPDVHVMTLAPFTAAQVGEQVRALTGKRPTRAQVDRIHAWSGGLPFYSELLIEDESEGREGVPETLRELLFAEIKRVAPEGRSVVEAASVESGELEHAALTAVVDEFADVETGIAEAVDAEILVPQSDGFSYRFRHDLLREAIHSGLRPADRMRWHARWAEYLESSTAATVDPFARIAAARHWVGAADHARAFDASVQGAQLASDLVAPTEEAQLLAQALDLWPLVPHPEERVGFTRDELFRRCSPLLVWVNDLPRLKHLLDTTSLEGEDPVRDIYLRILRNIVTSESGDVAAGPEDMDVLLKAPLENPWLPRAAARASFAVQAEHPAEAKLLADRAVASARWAVQADQEAGRDRGEVYRAMSADIDLQFSQHAALDAQLIAGNAEEAARGYAAMSSGQSLSRDLACDAESCQANALIALGRHREALVIAMDGLRRLTRPGEAPWRFESLVEEASRARIAMGEWDSAKSMLEGARAELDDVVARQLTALEGLLLCWQGDFATAGERDARIREDLPAPNSIWDSGLAWLSAELASARGDVPGVRAALGPLWSATHPEIASDRVWQPFLLALRVEVDVQLQSDRVAREGHHHLDRCRDVGARLHRIGAPGKAWDLHMTAELSRLDGPQDPSLWQAAVDAWSEAGHVREQALAQLALASSLAETGDLDGSSAVLASVMGTAADLGAKPLSAAAKQLARRARLPLAGPGVPETRTPLAGPLTDRELEVLDLLAEGRRNQQIAAHLFISPKTASVHVSRILAKLHAQSRTEAVALAQQRGLLNRE